MSILVTSKDLLSRAIRYRVSKGETGKNLLNVVGTATPNPRKINTQGLLKDTGESDILRRILDTAGKLFGWISNAYKRIKISAQGIYSWLVQASIAITTFDWNATDAAYRQQIFERNVQLASIWGGISGQAFGYLVGLGVGAGIGLICPVIGGPLLAGTIAAAVATEAVGDISGNLLSAITQTFYLGSANAALSGYINIRRWLKNPNNPIINSLFGEEKAADLRKNWGREGGPVVSMAGELDEKVESIPNRFFQAFVEEFVDESFDSFIEAGYVIAYELDNAFEMAKAANRNSQGPERAVIIEPDRATEDEVLTLYGPQASVIEGVQQAITTHRLIHNRDVGEILGEPLHNSGRATPLLRQLTIRFHSRPRPPFREPDGSRGTWVTCRIPDPRLGLTWREVKAAADAFNWGPWRATATLDNRRQMAVYGASRNEALHKLKELHRLSSTEILSLTVSEEEEKPEKLKKRPTRVYPVKGALLGRRQTLDGRGRILLDNRTVDEETIKFSLWQKDEPKNTPPLR